MSEVVINAIDWLSDIYDLVILDLVQFFKNRLIVFSTMLTSVSMIFAFGFGTVDMPRFDDAPGSYFTFIFPGIVAVGIMFSCTYTIGYAFIVDRHRRTIEDMVLSPISYTGFIFGRLVGMIIKCLLQFSLVIVIAMMFFGTTIEYPLTLSLAFLTESIFFAGLGIIVATFTNEVSFAGLVNLFVIPLTYFCGVFFPISNLGDYSAIVTALPLSAHIDVFRYAITGQASPFLETSHILSALYAVSSLLIAMYVFKRRVEHG